MSHEHLLELRFRLLSVFPLAFFIAQLVMHWRSGAIANILWMCNVMNLALAIGLIFDLRRVIRVSVLWLLLGIPIWIVDLAQCREWPVSTFFAHLGGNVVGLIAIHRIGTARNTWVIAFVWYLALQVFCRLFTPPGLNLNLAHDVAYVTSGVIAVYWKFWIAAAIVVGICLFVIERGLELFFHPSRRAAQEILQNSR